MASAQTKKKKPAKPKTANNGRASAALRKIERELQSLKNGVNEQQQAQDKLRQELAEVRKERDDYRQLVYAWLREKFPDDDLRTFPREKDCVPFRQIITEIEQQLTR